MLVLFSLLLLCRPMTVSCGTDVKYPTDRELESAEWTRALKDFDRLLELGDNISSRIEMRQTFETTLKRMRSRDPEILKEISAYTIKRYPIFLIRATILAHAMKNCDPMTRDFLSKMSLKW